MRGTCKKRGAESWRLSARCPRRKGFPTVVSNPWLLLRLLHFGVENHGRWAGNAAILTNAPEVQNHEDRSDDGNADAVPDVGAEERVGVDDGAAQEAEAHVVVRSHAQHRAEGAFVSEYGSGARHVGTDGDGS